MSLLNYALSNYLPHFQHCMFTSVVTFDPLVDICIELVNYVV